MVDALCKEHGSDSVAEALVQQQDGVEAVLGALGKYAADLERWGSSRFENDWAGYLSDLEDVPRMAR